MRTKQAVGADIARVDTQLLLLIAQRIALVREVGVIKKDAKEQIVRLDVENGRLASAAEFAVRHGLNPHFTEALLYFIIAESCKEQTMIHQGGGDAGQFKELSHSDYELNLIALCKAIAESYDSYGQLSFGTSSAIKTEDALIDAVVEQMPSKGGHALDLGCATGRISIALADRFPEVFGYDISPDMVRVASLKREKLDVHQKKKLHFKQHDVQRPLPLDSGSVSLAVMNLGTCSDIPKLRATLGELRRCLGRDGRAFLSFYNRESVFQRIGFLPWQSSFSAHAKDTCIEVSVGHRVFPVFASQYTNAEVRKLLDEEGFRISEIASHPTLASILPDSVLASESVRDRVSSIDRGMMGGADGYYLSVVAQKN
jgi:ubiquinone/menaquinone biosynthesis C-methylase UbiE/chorismate mutase